ncbi:MAG: RNA-binding S4 domain-containing protein [Halofilum sp. (in: g-proteobacteria)]
MEDIPGASGEGRQRIDRWLWASRFFKTRPLARAAVNAGRVEVNGAKAKPAKHVEVGDTVAVRGAAMSWVVVVRGLNEQRRPPPQAAVLYEETPESVAARTREREERRARRSAVEFDRQRPDRRDRRASIRFRRRQGGDD